MGIKTERFTTGRSVKECAQIFQRTAESARGVGSKFSEMAGKNFYGMDDDATDFFTPKDTPFSTLDDDPPTFSVGIHILKFAGGGNGAGTTVHMYVWDRSDFREVEISSPHNFGGGSRSSRFVRKFCNALEDSSPLPVPAPR